MVYDVRIVQSDVIVVASISLSIVNKQKAISASHVCVTETIERTATRVYLSSNVVFKGTIQKPVLGNA